MKTELVTTLKRQATKLVRKVFERVDHLVQHPKSGKPTAEFEMSVYREILMPPCRIFYRIAENIVYIIHVIKEERLFHTDVLRSR